MRLKTCILVIIINICIVNIDPTYCSDRRVNKTNSVQDDKEYSHSCQKVRSDRYILSSIVSPWWLNQEEAICRSQRGYPEYIEATKSIIGNSSAIEEMRRLYVIKHIWDNTPSLHTGVISFNPDNYIINEPNDYAGIKLGSNINEIGKFINTNNYGSKDIYKSSKIVNNRDYVGTKKATYVMYKYNDYEIGYYFDTKNPNGSYNTSNIVLSSDPKLKDEMRKWDDSDSGFFSKLMSSETPRPQGGASLKN